MVLGSSCLRGWDVGGPWACGENDVCPDGYTCDDQVCCIPGSSPACPTLPLPAGGCAEGEAKVYFQDADGDGDGNEKLSRVFCRAPRKLPGKPVWVTTGSDCDDTRNDIYFGAPELCNGKDDNCDRVIDEGLPNLQDFYRDEDGDGVGETAALVRACMAPPGYSALPGDCAPLDPAKFPGAPELCNNLDDDCDGAPDVAELSFVDADDGASSRFPCLVSSAKGVCRAGVFRCALQGSQVQRTCTSLASSAREVCDGLDNDCNGSVDEHPACGGPLSLVGQAGITYRAQRLSSGGTITSACQANQPGVAQTVSADGRTWTAVGVGTTPYHVWSAELNGTARWDLSRLDAQLRIAFNATAAAFTGAGGIWGTPPPYNPVIYLCGETDADFIRYRITNAGDALESNDTSFDKVMPLNNSSTTWLVGVGSGFDTSKVKRIEVLVFTNTTDFTITFQNATGFLP